MATQKFQIASNLIYFVTIFKKIEVCYIVSLLVPACTQDLLFIFVRKPQQVYFFNVVGNIIKNIVGK